MGDSSLTVYLGIAAWAVIVLALGMTAAAWRIPKRPVRVSLGLGVLGLLGGVVLSFGVLVLVTGLGMAVLIHGIRTRCADPQDGGIGK
jgi:hypothetical protein